MNSKWRIIFTSLAASALLAACGTSDPDKDQEGNADSAVEEPAAPAEDTEDNTSSEGDAEADSNTETNEDALKDAVETQSDEQDYSMMVLPGYKLTSEEPGRDSLYLEENSELFMRIETMPKGEESYTFDELYENTKELLAASSDGESVTDITDETELPQSEGILSVKGAKAESAEGYFTGYVMEREDKLVRVTIYAAEDNEHAEDFKEMAATIH
ncbi:hypothetical protein SporoP37_13790 [Sporosarcina sp. P37]|uniref:hypothetical protein n=1 Tax=unclassified Sporosarcina TaxID=2647733 RepID=UPI0009C155B4|nr:MULTISPECIES: hypothetical protein [unclassified Sporosarcina]ARD49141.1 hypothetical protein SporoP33_13455 [Sporosarcina sp. P33]ARK25618.1 hypothetical protein SporoP37_13790 [Sporosarcina sp. P37]PID18018.1 hypothetical protein CSV62_10395 [Sporosarcina sp. P35]